MSRRSKKPQFKVVGSVPCWAANYFVNADDSGLDEEDKRLCVEFEKKLLSIGLRLVCPIEDTRNEFDMWPAFGLGCDVEDWWAEVVPPETENETEYNRNENDKTEKEQGNGKEKEIEER